MKDTKMLGKRSDKAVKQQNAGEKSVKAVNSTNARVRSDKSKMLDRKLRRNNRQRAEQILLSDKLQDTENFTEVVKSDIYELLSNYFDVAERSLSITVNVDNYGVYTIDINCKADKLKKVRVVSHI